MGFYYRTDREQLRQRRPAPAPDPAVAQIVAKAAALPAGLKLVLLRRLLPLLPGGVINEWERDLILGIREPWLTDRQKAAIERIHKKLNLWGRGRDHG